MSQPGQFDHVDDFFGGGGKSISFDDRKGYVVGTPKGGVIVSIKAKQQQTDYKTKKPAFWDEAQREPKWTLPIEVQTNERDPETPHDDGRRTLWVQGGIERAIREALRATGAKIRPGGTLLVAWVAGSGQDGDPKQYRAQYTPAAETAADQMFAAPVQQAPQYAQPVAPQGQWSAPGSVTPATPQYAAPAPQWGAPQPVAAPQPQQWQTPAAQPAAPAPQWSPAPTPAAAAQPVTPPAPVGPLDPAAIDAAYAHLSADQRAAIVASGMSPEQIASVYGPPRAA